MCAIRKTRKIKNNAFQYPTMIVIIGLGTAGLYAARWISMLNRKEEITIIERRNYETYSPCSIPLVIEGAINIKEIIMAFPKTKRINLILNHEVVDVDVNNKKVLYRKNGEKEVMEIRYDKLIFAGGSLPKKPPIKGLEKQGVFTIRTVEDAEKILNYLAKAEKALVIGAGAIGMEIAYALRKRGIDVTIVEILSHPFPLSLDEDMAKIVSEKIQSMGIKCLCNSKVGEIVGGKEVKGAIINGKYEDFDMVILSTGVMPNTEIMKGKVNLDDRGFIIVNERMQTSNSDIYAAGDCVKTPYNSIQLATTAAKQGIVAGINASGGNAIYTPHTGAFVSAMGDFEISCVGKRGKFAGRGRSTINPYSKKEMIIKIFIDENGKITGAQGVGYTVSKKIDVISALMRKNSKIDDLAFMEHAYCPEASHLYDVLNIAAENAMRRLKPEKYIV